MAATPKPAPGPHCGLTQMTRTNHQGGSEGATQWSPDNVPTSRFMAQLLTTPAWTHSPSPRPAWDLNQNLTRQILLFLFVPLKD